MDCMRLRGVYMGSRDVAGVSLDFLGVLVEFTRGSVGVYRISVGLTEDSMHFLFNAFLVSFS